VVSSLVSTHLDYVNSSLYSTSLKNINRLQRIQYSLARVVTCQHSHALPSSTALFKQLHWLPVEWRVQFKLATMTFKALHTGFPPYLNDQLQCYQRTRSLRSSDSHQLVKPQVMTCLSDLELSTSLLHIFGIHCLPIFAKPSQFLLSDVISKRTTFSQPFPTHSNPPANAP